MTKVLSFYIAKRLSHEKGGASRASHIAVGIATAGVALGLAIMLISICILHGYKREIQSKIVGFGAHLNIQSVSAQYDGTTYPISITDSSLNVLQKHNANIKHLQKYSITSGVLKTGEAFQGASFKGIGNNYDLDFIHRHLVSGVLQGRKTIENNSIVISRTMAENLHLKNGDRIYAYFFDGKIRVRKFTIASIYETNTSIFDKNVVLTNLETINKINGWDLQECSGVEITLKQPDLILQTRASIEQTLPKGENGWSIKTINELYPQIFNWLQLMNMDVWVILILMFTVAGFTMVSGLLILILENIHTIGILKTLGATNRLIRHIFINYALFILIRSMLLGNILGLGLVWLQHTFHLVCLDPDKYYVAFVPVLWNIPAWILLNIGTFLLTMAVLVVPSFLVTRIYPAKTIRFE